MSRQLPVLRELGAEFDRVQSRERRREQLRRRRRLTGLATVVAASLSAGALAAGGVLTGDPVRDPAGQPAPVPTAGAGVELTGSARLSPLRVADPGGGPPWGLRILKTTRQLGCVQLGRVVDGRLGYLGRDGAFADDGRFHPLPANVVGRRDCSTLDGAGHIFLAISYSGLPASGEDRACTARKVPPPPAGVPQRALPICPAADERILFYGLLGPEATSVGYRDDAGKLRTVKTAGPEGAYVVALRPSSTRPAKGSWVPSTSPGSGLRQVTYRDGHTCVIPPPRRRGGARRCPTVGYVTPRRPRLSAARVAAPLTARFDPVPRRPPVPGGAEPADAQWRLTVAFTARVAARGRDVYTYQATLHATPGCTIAGVGGPISRDVRAGERVRVVQFLPLGCRGTVQVRIALRRPETADLTLPVAPEGGLTVGRAVARFPERP